MSYNVAMGGPELLLIIMGAVATGGAAVKALPVFWRSFKKLFYFLKGMESVSGLPGLIESTEEHEEGYTEVRTTVESILRASVANQEETKRSIKELAQDLRDHMKEEGETLRNELEALADLVRGVEDLKETLSNFSIATARVAFRQSVFAEEIAYYESIYDPGREEWILDWANKAFFRLTGLTAQEARASVYWAMNIAPEDRSRVHEVSEYAAANGEPLHITYTNIHSETGERIPVEVNSWPIFDLDGNVVSYFGIILRQDVESS